MREKGSSGVTRKGGRIKWGDQKRGKDQVGSPEKEEVFSDVTHEG